MWYSSWENQFKEGKIYIQFEKFLSVVSQLYCFQTRGKAEESWWRKAAHFMAAGKQRERDSAREQGASVIAPKVTSLSLPPSS